MRSPSSAPALPSYCELCDECCAGAFWLVPVLGFIKSLANTEKALHALSSGWRGTISAAFWCRFIFSHEKRKKKVWGPKMNLTSYWKKKQINVSDWCQLTDVSVMWIWRMNEPLCKWFYSLFTKWVHVFARVFLMFLYCFFFIQNCIHQCEGNKRSSTRVLMNSNCYKRPSVPDLTLTNSEGHFILLSICVIKTLPICRPGQFSLQTKSDQHRQAPTGSRS